LLRAIARSLVVLLPAGGVALVIDNSALGVLLTVSLPLLLVWLGAMGFFVRADKR